jgi:hypothetical protein
VLDSEPVGLLLHAGATVRSASIAAGTGSAVVVWRDTRGGSVADAVWGSIYAQRVLPH